jgi:hypothetical protein
MRISKSDLNFRSRTVKVREKLQGDRPEPALRDSSKLITLCI